MHNFRINVGNSQLLKCTMIYFTLTAMGWAIENRYHKKYNFLQH